MRIRKWARRAVMLALSVIFIGSVGMILFVLKQYKDNEKLYSLASGEYTSHADTDGESAPIVVDFDALRRVNEDIVGWIYCEGTVIDYPVMQGEDNDIYLHHAYDGTYSVSGSIFVDSHNKRGFEDSNTIIYGHHMKDGSMFAALSDWAEQQYYEEHPVMWLLTPEQDYKIVLFSGYTTSAYSDTYTMFSEPCGELDAYLQEAAARSAFLPKQGEDREEGEDGEGRYVVLSTCAYVFDNARDVLHGKLAPVESAGGVKVTEEAD